MNYLFLFLNQRKGKKWRKEIDSERNMVIDWYFLTHLGSNSSLVSTVSLAILWTDNFVVLLPSKRTALTIWLERIFTVFQINGWMWKVSRLSCDFKWWCSLNRIGCSSFISWIINFVDSVAFEYRSDKTNSFTFIRLKLTKWTRINCCLN